MKSVKNTIDHDDNPTLQAKRRQSDKGPSRLDPDDWCISDISPNKTLTPSSEQLISEPGIISPPSQFRVLVTPSDSLTLDSSHNRKISSDLKKEIELSLLHWPSNVETTTASYCSLKRPPKSSNTLPQLADSGRGLSLPGRNTGRPLSWSYDATDAKSLTAPMAASGSNHSIGCESKCTDSLSYCTPASSCTTVGELDVFTGDDSSNTAAEFGDAVTALRSFNSKHSFTRDNRRMSQPHPIKVRNLPSKHSVSSLHSISSSRPHTRCRSKSEPDRLVHDNIRQNFSKQLASICRAVGDIASLELRSHRHLELPSLAIADPLWHHVTNEPEELSFRVGDVIMVLDKSDKDWWWGRRSVTPTASNDDIEGQHEAGWFPSTFVRLRANQAATTDELLEDIKQGTASTASVVQQYGSSLLSRDQARCNVINEIVTAEKEYVKHLRDIVEGFKFKASERTDMFTDRQLSLIFGNISEIYEMARQFLEELEATVVYRQSVHKALVGRCFLQHKDKFAIYSPYCNNHPRALEELQKLGKDSKYIHFFEACRLLQNMIELPLDGFLLSPIQKICKYPLQLGELLKYTSADHEDYPHLQEAFIAMKDIAMLINERKRKLESMQKVAEWQAGVDDWQGQDMLAVSSELIHSGELCKLSSAGRLVERHFFLFDHQLVQCKKELLKKSLIYKSRFFLDDHSMISVEDGKVGNSHTSAKNAMELQDQDGNCVLFLTAKSPADKEKWMKFFSKEREIIQHDIQSGFVITESFLAVAKLSTPSKTNKPSKSNSLTHNEGKTGITIMDNNNKLTTKQRSGNGLIHKLKRAKITT
ncbi:rho guanine nucleotide exchange factor 4-like [Watersipora subatra]|uniref:rho guanine nucleotide exchange factor 4-like n=1 Tax=Watersipora subatra TaxID=2589382 RepID=UPI00355BAED4